MKIHSLKWMLSLKRGQSISVYAEKENTRRRSRDRLRNHRRTAPCSLARSQDFTVIGGSSRRGSVRKIHKSDGHGHEGRGSRSQHQLIPAGHGARRHRRTQRYGVIFFRNAGFGELVTPDIGHNGTLRRRRCLFAGHNGLCVMVDKTTYMFTGP